MNFGIRRNIWHHVAVHFAPVLLTHADADASEVEPTAR